MGLPRRGVVLICLVMAAGCAPDPAVLVVDLKTDYLAGVEIDGARLEVTSSSGELRTLPDVTIAEGATLLTGQRIGEISVPPGDHRLVLTLQRGNAPVATRAVSVTVTVDRAVTVLATRSCEDVRCEAPDSECVGGVCVSERCTPETPESCPAPACVADADCVPALSCGVGTCEGGVCFEAPTDAVCDVGYGCDPVDGCVARPPIGWATGPSFGPLDTLDGLHAAGFDDFDPFLSADGLTLYFATTREGGRHIWQASRPSLDEGFDAPVAAGQGINDDGLDAVAFRIAPGGLVAMIASGRAGGPGLTDVWLAERASLDQPFGAWTVADALCTDRHDLDPFPTATQVWLAPLDVPGDVGVQDLWVADGVLPSGVGAPRRVDELSTTSNEQNPSLTADERVIVFSSDRAGVDDSDLYYALRADAGATFEPPVRIDALSMVGRAEEEPFVRGDGGELFFTVREAGELRIQRVRVQ